MKITDIATVVVNAEMRNWLFAKVTTDQPGLVGWGEATLEWKTRGVAGTIEDLKPLVVGQDPRDIEHLYQTMTKHGFWRLGAVGLSAISGIEQALWDIKGKDLGVPVWQLLGGKVRDRIRLYTHLGLGNMKAVYETFELESLQARADEILAKGYTAFKVVFIPYSHYTAPIPAVKHVERLMAGLREHVGDHIDIMIDFHGRPPSVSVAEAYVRALAPSRPYFVEEVLPPGQEAAMRHITESCGVPVATGERLLSRLDFVPLFENRAVNIIQPDLSHCGGLWEARKIAAMAETYLMGVAPHNPNGPVAGAVAVHFDMATPNVIIQESMIGQVPWYDEVVRSSLRIENGHWLLPTAPGLGIEIDEAAAARHPYRPEVYHTTHAAMPDGTVVDW